MIKIEFTRYTILARSNFKKVKDFRKWRHLSKNDDAAADDAPPIFLISFLNI